MSFLPHNLTSLHRWFGRYCRSFFEREGAQRFPLGLKIVHCQRVRREMVALAAALKLPAYLARLAAITGLLHDIGRFEQFLRYRTFDDSRSADHAALGLAIIEQERLLGFVPEQQRQWVRAAIANHNRFQIAGDLHGEALLLARMIRDVDKLDIWRVFVDYCRQPPQARDKTVVRDLPDSPGVSPAVVRDIMAGRLVEGRHIRSQNDFAVMRLGWVFDLNFHHSFAQVVDRGYLESQAQVLPQNAEMRAIMARVTAHVRAQLHGEPALAK